MSSCEYRRFAVAAACMSHLLDSEYVSASFTVTALIYTINTSCLPNWKQGHLCVRVVDATLFIETLFIDYSG